MNKKISFVILVLTIFAFSPIFAAKVDINGCKQDFDTGNKYFYTIYKDKVKLANDTYAQSIKKAKIIRDETIKTVSLSLKESKKNVQKKFDKCKAGN